MFNIIMRRGGVLQLLSLLFSLELALGQQSSPLAGQGLPPLETTEIYLNIFMDRLIDVDSKRYMHESIILIGTSWRDPSALPTVQANEEKMKQGNYTCDVPCWSNILHNGPCCDDVYMPTFSFGNVVGFSQDRQVDSEMYFGPNGSVLWAVSVYGSYFQPMSFENYPFTTIDLIITFDFIDTSMFVEGHPGVKVIPSAAGPRVFDLGLGDDSPQWNINNVSIETYNGPPLLYRMRRYSTSKSVEGDVAPFNPRDENTTNWATEPKFNRQSLFFIIRVSRFWQWNLVYGVLPVLLCAILGLLVFFQDPGDLGGRISVIVTVFLAMTAIQFVLNESTPQSTYIQPLQQTILLVYVCFSIAAIESICVYNLVHWKRFSAEKEARIASWKSYKERMAEWKDYKIGKRKPQAKQHQDGNHIHGTDEDDDEKGYHSSQILENAHSASQEHFDQRIEIDTHSPDSSQQAKSQRWGIGMMKRMIGQVKSSTTFTGHLLKREDDGKPTMSSILSEDADYGKALAYYLDKWTFGLLTLTYIVAIPVIFATQSGYVPLFSKRVLDDAAVSI